jgi:hypothetical protein
MGQFVDNLIAYRILNLLVTPFENTEAYKLGIIDKKGKELKPMSALNTVQEREAYTLLHRLVYRLKKIVEKIPIENKRLLSLAAAYSLIRESLEQNHEPIDLENKFLLKSTQSLDEEVLLVKEYFSNKKMYTFRQYTENLGIAPANNAAASPGVAGVTGEPPVGKRKLLRRKANV